MSNTERQADPYPLVTPADFALAATEIAHAGLARVLSSERGDALARPLGRLATTIRPGKRRALETLYREMVGDRADMPAPETYVPDLIATLLEQRMIYARLGADMDWRPSEFVFDGTEAVSAALRSGRGVVLWLLPLEMIALLVRMACHDLGWPFGFMSHWRHGPSTSRIGDRLINARACRIEAQFGPRLVMTDGDTKTALAKARQRLEDGGVIAFRGIGWAARPTYYKLFAGQMHLAFGAPATARKAGAALFRVSCARTERGYRVGFAPVEGAGERPLDEIGAEFAAALEAAAIAAPTLWSVKSRQWQPGDPPAAPLPAQKS